MRALSLWQPWAQLIAVKHKRIETRSWPPPGARVGERIAIHASKRKAKPHQFTPKENDMLLAALGPAWHKAIPYGAIVCTARLAAVEEVLQDRSNIPRHNGTIPSQLSPDGVARQVAVELAFGDYEPGRFMWKLEDIHPLEEPIAYRGEQRLFEIDMELP